MKFGELKELLHYDEYESKIYIPNEIFNDLKNSINNSPHLAFTYSYYYLISWLYRYTKYGNVSTQIDNTKMKEILGYNGTTKGLDYLIKKNGTIDKIGYTNTIKDFPAIWTFENGILEFTMLSEMEKFDQELIKKSISRKFTIKYPVKAFFRTNESQVDNYEDGTFYDITNTHCIQFEVFMYCMSNEKIGTIGFYLYSYIKRMNDIFHKGWDVSIENMIVDTGLTENTLLRYLDQLKKYKMIETIHNQEYFCLALDLKERKANTYISNNFDSFTYEPQQYEKMKVITTNKHYKMMDEELEKLFGNNETNISINELPY